jgi:Tol biopolymer transport system component/C-terminal processing protease CtpA/Prc
VIARTTCTLLAGLALAASVVHAQLPPPTLKPVVAPRMPALSPDGSQLAFVYKGDIWIAPAQGGRATVLTRNVEMDAYPQFSPDGAWIVFASQRTGNWDLYAVPATGGVPKRLTWHSSGENAYGWSPDGKQVIFATGRETGENELLTLDVQTLKLRMLLQDIESINHPSFSPDGKKVVFGRRGFHWTRPRYHGSAAMQIAILDVATGKSSQITDNGRQHLWTRFMPDGRSLITVTYGDVTPSSHKLDEAPGKLTDSPDRTPNLWLLGLDGKGRRITEFVGGPVRCPNVAARTGDVVFEHGADLYVIKAENGKLKNEAPRKIVLTAGEDEAVTQVRRETLTSGVTEAEPSPDGKTFAFGVRGDIFTIAVEKPKGVAAKPAEIAKRLTDWVGDDSDFLWSSDGKKLYYRSDRDYINRIFELEIATGKTRSLWTRSDDAGQLKLSPDGKELWHWVAGKEGGLYAVTIETGAARRVITMPDATRNWQSGGDLAWSPDLQWLAVCVNELAGPWSIFIVPAAGGTPVNVTRLNAYHGQPRWTPDGKYLFFQSDRDGAGLYAIPLTKEQARLSEMDLKYEKPTGLVKVQIDFDGITERIRKLSGQNPDGDMTVAETGITYFISAGDIWSASYDGKEVKRLTSTGGHGALRITKDGKRAFFVRSGELYSMRLEGSNPTEKVTFSADIERDAREERQAAFTQFWSAYNRRFYDPNMHGRDWEAVRKRYEPILESVETRSEFATLLQMMVGELEASHSEVGAAGGGNPSASTPHLGFTYDYAHDGPGIKVAEVLPGSPASFEKTRIKPGEYVMAVNGQDASISESFYRGINNLGGREFEFLVNDKPTKEGARTVKYVSLGYGEWGNLRYVERVTRLARYVDEKSKGEIGYVHISGMGGGNAVTFDREFYERSIGKKAMIIDVRFNGGGNISDSLIDRLERRPHGYYQSRDGLPEPAPGTSWTKPVIVLLNEHSFSNAEMFPSAMKTRGIAKLVGMPTPGYVIWTWGLPLVDGTSGRMPGSGVYRLDGTPMENMGEQPDVRVPMTNEDWQAKRDPQLDKALELLMK